jgi:hypothetical protein
MTEKRTCQECGEEIHGRIDKKFCSDQCRNTFNNRTQLIENNYIRKVNYNLRKNRRIMEEILATSEKEVKKVHRNQLMDRGFDFSYFTNIYDTKNGNRYFFCYEFGYNKLDDNYFALVKREEYLK